MSIPCKILVAYDGSSCADGMLGELSRAGLPEAVESVVMTVTERWLPPPSMYEAIGSTVVPHAMPAGEIAEEGAATLRKLHPQWQVTALGATGSPAKKLLRQGIEWGADLIVAGATGHSSLQRVLVGSVTHKLVNQAPCTVRVSRGFSPEKQGPAKLLLAHDGQPGADTAVAVVAKRNWPPGTEIRLVSCAVTPSSQEDHQWMRDVLEKAARRLQDSGLTVSTAVLQGDPRKVIVEEAARVEAECIFAGDNDRSTVERLLLGTVSSAILARAHCSVEICR